MIPYSLVWAIPFAGLLLTIGLAPLVAAGLWHRHYGMIAALWAAGFFVPNLVQQGVAESLAAILRVGLHEYLPFVLLLGTLFTVAGGLRIKGTPRASPALNTAVLAFGCFLAGWIGTTGAAMVTLRPLIRINRYRSETRHLFIFFIFLVGNIGGALSPLGDPPLYLGFLLGVPFFWPLTHLLLPSLLLAAALLAVFYVLDAVIFDRYRHVQPKLLPAIEQFGIDGGINLLLLAAVIGTVLLRGVWHPAAGIAILGVGWGAGEMVCDALLVIVATLSLLLTPAGTRRANEFSWGPMIEVAILFAAIFVTILPVMAMIAAGANGPVAPLLARLFVDGVPNETAFYWVTGTLSAFLDNAPTYVVFFGFAGDDAARLSGPLAPTLAAISAASVYFGAMSYVGNAPNFMVKAIVESHGIRMPSFFGYFGWATLALLPWLALIAAIFYR